MEFQIWRWKGERKGGKEEERERRWERFTAAHVCCTSSSRYSLTEMLYLSPYPWWWCDSQMPVTCCRRPRGGRWSCLGSWSPWPRCVYISASSNPLLPECISCQGTEGPSPSLSERCQNQSAAQVSPASQGVLVNIFHILWKLPI